MLTGRSLIHQCSLANQFAALRTESNNARGPVQQLWLVIRRGLTCRLYALYDRIEGVKSKLEVRQTISPVLTQ